ncbi:MAG: DoxX family protein [Bdellovibrionia bacterium]
MSKATLISRILLGLIFFVFGLNGFFHFMPMPPMPEKSAAFFTAMLATGYFLPVISGTQVLAGAMLLTGLFVPLALVILAPVILQIFLFHVFLDPSGLGLAIFIGALEIYLAFFSQPYSPIVKQIFRCPKREGMQARG